MRLKDLTQIGSRSLRRMQVRLLHLGPETKAIPMLVFTTFHNVVDLSLFSLHQDRAGRSGRVLWNFVVRPEEMEKIVKAISMQPTLHAEQNEGQHLSINWALPDHPSEGSLALETLFNASSAKAILTALYDSLDLSNGLALELVKLYRKASLPQS